MSKLFDEIGAFTTIPNTVMKMLPELGSDSFVLWSYLRYRTNSESGVAFPGYETIKTDTGLNYRKIARSLRTIESLNLMTRKKRFGNSSEYTLTMPSPNNGCRTVLTEGTGKSSQWVQTIKNDSIKKDNIKTVVPVQEPVNIFKIYENEIGLVTPIIADALKDAEKDYPADWIVDALKISAQQNKRNWAYTRAILVRWKAEGRTDKRVNGGKIDSAEQARQERERKEANDIIELHSRRAREFEEKARAEMERKRLA